LTIDNGELTIDNGELKMRIKRISLITKIKVQTNVE